MQDSCEKRGDRKGGEEEKEAGEEEEKEGEGGEEEIVTGKWETIIVNCTAKWLYDLYAVFITKTLEKPMFCELIVGILVEFLL